jgi:hypothetical protein
MLITIESPHFLHDFYSHALAIVSRHPQSRTADRTSRQVLPGWSKYPTGSMAKQNAWSFPIEIEIHCSPSKVYGTFKSAANVMLCLQVRCGPIPKQYACSFTFTSIIVKITAEYHITLSFQACASSLGKRYLYTRHSIFPPRLHEDGGSRATSRDFAKH